MAPRRYSRHGRDAAAAATRARIVQAVAELHAEIGPSRTTYAMIAKRADVAVPTVYKYLPNLAALFDACVGHVLGQAPPLDPEVFAGCDDTPLRLQSLVRVLCARYRFLAPWLRWETDEAQLPDLSVHRQRMHNQRLKLIAEALAPSFGQRPPPALTGLIDVLLDFRTWQGLTRDQGLTEVEVETAISAAAEAMLAGYAGASLHAGEAARPNLTRGRRSS